MNNADKFEKCFGIYATELWAMPEQDFLKWLSDEAKEKQWVPCEIGLPNDRSWYLGIFREADTGWVNPIPFICDYIGHDTGVTTLDYWVLKDHEDDREFGFDYYRNMECVAWMPLPETYDGEMENDKEV